MDRPSNEVMKDFQEHQGWVYTESCILTKMNDCKEKLLYAKSIEEVQKIQTQYDTYKSILNTVRKPK